MLDIRPKRSYSIGRPKRSILKTGLREPMTGLIRRVLAAELTAAELDEFIKFIIHGRAGCMTLKDLRTSAGKTVKETAAALNVTVRAVSRYEQGTRQISLEQVLILAELYDCSERDVIDAVLNSRR